ncbi:MAG TPA: glycosyltransferase family 4 protein [bacterium]|nr:glycosyltransferase family 4 protein [bacterium]HPQ65719.1 glycosyltransferase family 4 protein [bacterium]
MDPTFQVVVSVGGRFHAFELARQLHRRGCLKRLITSYPRGIAVRAGVPRDKIVSAPAKEIVFRGWRRLPGPLRERFRPHFLVSDLFDRSARKALEECDIVTGWSGFSKRTFEKARRQGTVTVLERGSSHILTQAELLEREYRARGLRPIGPHPRIIEKELEEYARADYIAIPSTFVEASFREHGVPPSKLIRIPYGTDLERFRPGDGPADGIFRVVFAGRICLRKGVYYLLKAFTDLDLDGSELLLAGDVDREAAPLLRRYRRRVTWLGKLSPEELARLYRRATVFVMPSIEEGMAMVQVQALASGLPLLCTPNSGGGDLIADGREGLVFPAGDADALGESLLSLYRDRDKVRAMSAAAAAAARRFGWDEYGKHVHGAYRRILEERR